MHRRLPCLMAAACGLALLSGLAASQEPASKKDDLPKTEESTGKKQSSDRDSPALDKMKIPPGAVLILVDELKEALKVRPKMVLMSPEAYQELQDRILQLEKQLKPERRLVHSCKLSGKLEGDFITMRADFAFTTEALRTTIYLGLQGAFLVDEGDLDGAVPTLDYSDDGYAAKVEKEGIHRLVLNLRLPVGLKRAPGVAGGAERGFDLGLPGAAVTTLALELPPGVKEVRWNGNLEKQRVQNRWELALGKIKTVAMAWKEPVTLPGQGPLLSAESQVSVKLDATHVHVTAEMTLEDLRGQTTEWRLLLPPGARVEVKVPGSLAFDVINPDGNNPHHVLKLKEPSGERIAVNVQSRLSRPAANTRASVGPFAVVGAYRQQGVIRVNAPAEATRGQRLLYHRHGETYQRDLPNNAPADLAAMFQYWNLSGKTMKGPAYVPLELELKPEKGQVESTFEHVLRVRPSTEGWIIDAKTRFLVKTPQAGVESLELQLPRLRLSGLESLAVNPSAGFPATLFLGTLLEGAAQGTPFAQPLDFFCEGESGCELGPPDAQRRARLFVSGTVSREFTVMLTGKYLVPFSSRRVRAEPPRLLGTLDRGGKVILQSDGQLDLMVGPVGSEVALTDKRQIQSQWDRSPQAVEVAWAQHRSDLAVSSVADVTVRDDSTQVRQQLSFSLRDPTAGGSTLAGRTVRLKAPRSISKLTVASGGRLLGHERDREVAVVAPTLDAAGKADLVIEYDLGLPQEQAPAATTVTQSLREIPLLWLEGAARHDMKVRAWTQQGVFPALADGAHTQLWRQRGAEVVAERDSLPALVLESAGEEPSLVLSLSAPGAGKLAALIGDRALIQTVVDEDGTQTYRARYLLRKINTHQIALELPLPAESCLTYVQLDQKKISWRRAGTNPRAISIPVEASLYNRPVVLEIAYKVPASFAEKQGFFQTLLAAPSFRDDLLLGRARWQVNVPDHWLSVPAWGAVPTEWKWGLQGWLFGPEPSVSSAELEKWFTGREVVNSGWPVSLTFWNSGTGDFSLFHLPRQIWLLLCSVAVLGCGLLLFLAPFSRAFFWLLLVLMAAGIIALSWTLPGWVAPFAMGCQPGLLVLAVVLAANWMLRESYRRQVVFMPGFTRLKPGSSLIQGGSGKRPREITTVDAPVASVGSSANQSAS
ncbi:MAG: hypothetical protein HY040_15485 [Planctomycetes bacterium]|nr:hypothetical protein [Planctomycetota bacterium]